ncbi:MAG TPA: hypothetical protein VFS36_12480 [Chitinophagaceae bacterium]|jgi:hypothetical protein|nr:hypothetical protein [Chitinophagaceae bacterium]
MKTKYSILFFTAIILLVACEYIFLSELTEAHRIPVLVVTALGVLLSASTVIFCYTRSGKDAA